MSPFFEALSNAHKKHLKNVILSSLNMNFGLYLFLCIALYNLTREWCQCKTVQSIFSISSSILTGRPPWILGKDFPQSLYISTGIEIHLELIFEHFVGKNRLAVWLAHHFEWKYSQPQERLCKKQGRIHGYPSRVRVGRGCIWGHSIIWAGAVRPKTAKTQKK